MKAPVLILAPMRGITTMHYRQAFVQHFGGLDVEMAPFIPTVSAERINPKLLKDVLPENNSGLPLIPQVIGNNADDFVQMNIALHDLGYDEVNWNMGCPHKPIRKKRRGSGLIPFPDTVGDRRSPRDKLSRTVGYQRETFDRRREPVGRPAHNEDWAATSSNIP